MTLARRRIRRAGSARSEDRQQEGLVTTAKRLGLASMVLICLGASAAYYGTMMALQGRGKLGSGLNSTDR